MTQQVSGLHLEKLEELEEVLLDFTKAADLTNWLKANKPDTEEQA